MSILDDDVDITKDILIDKLIRETTDIQTYWWSKRNCTTYYEYVHRHKLKGKVEIVFKIYHYKTHDGHSINVFIQKGEYKYTQVFIIQNNPRVFELIKTINDTNSVYNLDV